MTEILVKKASLWRESLKAVKTSMLDFLPWMFGYSVLMAVFYFLMNGSSDLDQQIRNDPNFLKQHPEAMHQVLQNAALKIVCFLPILVLMTVGHYVLTVRYLQMAMKNNRPDYSVGGYFYWLRKLFRKWSCAFWIFLPIIGFFFYARSIYRYQVVTPLAVLKRGDEVRTSWNLTEGKWWRIFGNNILFKLLLFVPILPLLVICMIGMLSANTTTQHASIDTGILLVVSLFQGLVGGLMAVCNSIFCCVCYKILSQEARQAQGAAQPAATLPPA